MSAPTRTREDVLAEINARSASKGTLALKERSFRHSPEPDRKPAKAKRNGGPRVFASDLEEFTFIAKSIYPLEAWIPRFAKDIGEHPRQVRRWVNGEATISPRALVSARDKMVEHYQRARRSCIEAGLMDPNAPGI